MIKCLIELQVDPGNEAAFFQDLRAMSDKVKAQGQPIFWKVVERNDSEHPGAEADTRQQAFASLREASEFGVASGSGYSPMRIAGKR